MEFSPSSSIASPGPYRHQRPSVAFDTIALIVVSIASFSLASRVEWDSPRFGTLLRLIPVGGALLWLFRRMSGCEVGSRAHFGGNRGSQGEFHGPFPYTEMTSFPPGYSRSYPPPQSFSTTVPVYSPPASAFPGGGPGAGHLYSAVDQPHLQDGTSSGDDDMSLFHPIQMFPIDNNSGPAPVYSQPPSHSTSSSLPRVGRTPPQAGGGFMNWLFRSGSGSTTTSSPTSLQTGPIHSYQPYDHPSPTSDWSSHSGGGGGGSEPVMYSVGNQNGSQSGSGPSHQYHN